MAKIASIDDLKEYCFRALGKPVINIEVETQQAYDRIDDALKWFSTHHIHGSTEQYLKVTFTAADEARQMIRLPEEMIAVTEIIDPGIADSSGRESFDKLNYLIAQSDYFDFTRKGGREYDLLSFDLTMQYISMMNMYFKVKRNFSFSKVTHMLMIPSGRIVEGNFIIVKGYMTKDPDKAPDIYNEVFIREYATALMKRQWGANLKKYDGVQMVGGVTLNGQAIFDEAQTEIDKLMEQFKLRYEAPLGPRWG